MNKYYDIVKSIIHHDETIPAWVKNYANSFPYLLNGTEFPRIDDGFILTNDYISSLKRHVEVAASSPEGFDWANKLQCRYNALFPYVGKLVFSAGVHCPTDHAFLYIDPESARLIICEIYDMRGAPEKHDE